MTYKLENLTADAIYLPEGNEGYGNVAEAEIAIQVNNVANELQILNSLKKIEIELLYHKVNTYTTDYNLKQLKERLDKI